MKPTTTAGSMPRVEAETIALRALAHVVADADLGPRLLDVTGLQIADLRARAADPALLAATLAFLEAHEPSLTACARALDLKPDMLIAAHARLRQ
jgi:hypothetical protein